MFFLNNGVTVQEALVSASSFLGSSDVYFGHGTDNAWDESVALLLWSMGLEEDPGESVLSSMLDSDARDRFVDAVNIRTLEKVPAAYITGQAWFCGLRFIVDSRVLVPRSPIAELIQNAYRPWILKPPQRILDLCCGSGCIGIAAAMHESDSEVVLADLSAEALQVAEKNLDLFNVHERVSIVQSDLFEQLEDELFDLILCNPPYVDKQDIESMPDEYRQEPSMGLGSGDDGLDITRRVLKQAKSFLREKGVLILEVGNSWENLEQAFPSFPFTWIEFANGGQGVCVISREELEISPFGD